MTNGPRIHDVATRIVAIECATQNLAVISKRPNRLNAKARYVQPVTCKCHYRVATIANERINDMRVRNPKRATRYDDRCNCEHINHFTDRYDDNLRKLVAKPRTKHRYRSRRAGKAWGMYVGHVCDDCAATCMQGWIVSEHVCGTGDCK